MSGVIRKRDWSQDELQSEGFQHYPRKKEITMVRVLDEDEAPLRIQTGGGDTLIARAGYKICYRPGDEKLPDISDYDHWPVEPDIFAQTYTEWDGAFTPTAAQRHLMDHGCRPYFKKSGVWAKPLEEPVYIQGVEHENPVLVEEERMLAIGAEGEPYHMGNQTFSERYNVPKPTLWQRLRLLWQRIRSKRR